jgi:hypothetical protein
MGDNGEKLPGELYAKVLRDLPASRAGFYVHFTSISSEVATFFQRLLVSGAPGSTA